MDNFNIVGSNGHGFARTIKESIYIMVNNPNLNRKVGIYNLPHIRDRVPVNILELQIKHQGEHLQQAYRTSLVPPRACRAYVSADINNPQM